MVSEGGREGGREGRLTWCVLIAIGDSRAEEGVVNGIRGIEVITESSSGDIDVLEHAHEVTGGGEGGRGGGVVDEDGACRRGREGRRKGGRRERLGSCDIRKTRGS
jgi:hypothetical protein